jgi:ABC-type transport system substrate-binding protein
MFRSTRKIFEILLFIFMIFSQTVIYVTSDETEPLATLELIVYSDTHLKFGKEIAEQLALIGLEILVEQIEGEIEYELKLKTGNYDLAMVTFTETTTDPDLSHIYAPEGLYNYFGINTIIPYGNISKTLLDEGIFITNITEKQNHYYEWQEIIVDKIIPILPFFSLTGRNEDLPYSYDLLAFNLESSFWGGSNHFIWLDTLGKAEYTIGLAIRKAICYCINRIEINEKLHKNTYTINHSPISYYLEFYYYEDILKYENNIEKAFEWLEAAGFEDVTAYESSFTYFSIIAFPLVVIYYKRRKNK